MKRIAEGNTAEIYEYGEKLICKLFYHEYPKDYYNANGEEKVRLTKEMILKAIKKVKSKGTFDYDQFAVDFKEIF